MCFIVRNIPTDLYTLTRHIEVPNLPLLVHRFLESQLSNDTGLDIALPPDLSVSPVSVFHSAIATFYAPSDLSGLGGMHTECIRSTLCWRKAQARYDTVFLKQDPDIPGMGGLHVGRVFLFFLVFLRQHQISMRTHSVVLDNLRWA